MSIPCSREYQLKKELCKRLGGTSVNGVPTSGYETALIMELLLLKAGVVDEYGFFKIEVDP
jgi:hypothetical protein